MSEPKYREREQRWPLKCIINKEKEQLASKQVEWMSFATRLGGGGGLVRHPPPLLPLGRARAIRTHSNNFCCYLNESLFHAWPAFMIPCVCYARVVCLPRFPRICRLCLADYFFATAKCCSPSPARGDRGMHLIFMVAAPTTQT